MKCILVLLLLSAACAAQTARVVEVLPEDSFIVEINGRNYRALNADKIRELLKQKVDLDASQKTNAELLIQIRELTLQRDLAHAQEALEKQKADSLSVDLERTRGDAARWQGLFTEERQARREASQFIPHSSVKGFWGRFLTALDHPAAQSAFKIGLPILNTLRCQQ